MLACGCWSVRYKARRRHCSLSLSLLSFFPLPLSFHALVFLSRCIFLPHILFLSSTFLFTPSVSRSHSFLSRCLSASRVLVLFLSPLLTAHNTPPHSHTPPPPPPPPAPPHPQVSRCLSFRSKPIRFGDARRVFADRHHGNTLDCDEENKGLSELFLSA